MSIFSRFRAIPENDKAAVVRKLMESSTPDFDFFYLVGLSVLMATFGLLVDSIAIVIGSMLIAPILYPILGVALGIVMSNYSVFKRSIVTLLKSFGVGLCLSFLATLLFVESDITASFEIMNRTEVGLLHFLIAVIAGAAVAFTLGKSEWSETLPGIAISVALIPPLAVIGIGVAALNPDVIAGSLVMLIVNIIGIIFAAMVTFSLMNLYEKQNIAVSTIKRENDRVTEEATAIEKLDKELQSDEKVAE
ncbi:MAG: TIGR00341 family protein [Candidatus Paceibacterota bacterium]